jgi:hypothetical protein
MLENAFDWIQLFRAQQQLVIPEEKVLEKK